MTKVATSFICPYCGYILPEGKVDRCPQCLEVFCIICLQPEVLEIKKKSKEEMYLNHGDISNEIETRLGLYDPNTGNDMKSRNTTFWVQFDETEKGYLKVTIEKELFN